MQLICNVSVKFYNIFSLYLIFLHSLHVLNHCCHGAFFKVHFLFVAGVCWGRGDREHPFPVLFLLGQGSVM